jgi:hypothetical protein
MPLKTLGPIGPWAVGERVKVRSTKLLTKYGKNVYLKIFSFFVGVVDTTEKHEFTNFQKNPKGSQWDTKRPRGL